jgi:arylsulfatase A-like enzyme
LILFAFLFHKIYKYVGRIPFGSGLIGAFLVLVISVLVKNDKDWLSKKTVDQRFEFYDSGRAGVQQKSPIVELFESYSEYLSYLQKQNFITANADVLSEHGVEFAYKNYQFLGAELADYPLVRTTRFDSKMEFVPDGEGDKGQKKNIIVFFAEGISTRLVEPYHDYFEGLTPNIKEFSKYAVRVNNYHSHTYATYRALGGQLCSIYPVGGLYKEVNYYCLGHALRDAEYQNYFFVSQRLDNTDLEEVVSKTGFENIYGTELLLEQEPSYRGSSENPRQSNPVLDTFYNFDKRFGKFWEYFKQSPFYNNTIVIVTSDHATFPSKDYIAELRAHNVEGYKAIFTDDIPLLIYHPQVDGGIEYDAKGTSSIDFALSVLHLKETKAPFLEQSIFSDRQSVPLAGLTGGQNQTLFKNRIDVWQKLMESNIDKLHPIGSSSSRSL